ncbi:MAG: RING finger domain-containing protein [Candidatus Odinarchaeota archaeon]
MRGYCPACKKNLKEENIIERTFYTAMKLSDQRGIRKKMRKITRRHGKPLLIACSDCGAKFQIGHEKCPACGRKMESCGICMQYIESEEVTGACPQCGRMFHYSHVLSAIASFGKCPACRTALEIDEIKMITRG